MEPSPGPTLFCQWVFAKSRKGHTKELGGESQKTIFTSLEVCLVCFERSAEPMAEEEDFAHERDDDTGDDEDGAGAGGGNGVVEVSLPPNMDVEVCTIQVRFNDGTLAHYRLLNMEIGALQVVANLKLAQKMRDPEFDPPTSTSFLLTHYSDGQDTGVTTTHEDGSVSLWYKPDDTGNAMRIRLVAPDALATGFVFVEHDTDDAPTLRTDAQQDKVVLHVIVRIPAAYVASCEQFAAATGHAPVARRCLGNTEVNDLAAAEFGILCNLLGLSRCCAT